MVAEEQERKDKKSGLIYLAKKKEDIPSWVSDNIQNAKFEKPETLTRTGYLLEIYEKDNKVDAQLYEAVEDGRHIVTLDLSEDMATSGLEKGVVYEFTFRQYRAPLEDKVSKWLLQEKEIEMTAIYRFELDSQELLDVDSNAASEE